MIWSSTTAHGISGGVALVLVVPAAACGDDGDMDDDKATPEVVHWGYDGEAGPDRWGDLTAEFATCADGVEQSPIDLADAVPSDLPSLTFDYRPSPLLIQNNGHTVQVTYEAGSSITIGDQNYELIQFHFHASSEHTVDGEDFPMEMHLVHQSANDRLAVVGVFLTGGAQNPGFDSVFENLPAEEAEQPKAIEGASVNAGELLPGNRSYFTYPGSLTTPPCSEGVSWFVLREPVELSAEQIEAFTAIFDRNHRPVQPLGDRELLVKEE